jgi:antagonist of KipI
MKAPIQATNTIEVLRPGAMTTVQDLGRKGLLSAGVPVGGAMDRMALRVANMLVGNPENTPALETTMAGPLLRFKTETLVAVCGAVFAGVASWQPFVVKAGEILSLANLGIGCRGYVAIAGGFVIKPVMGSASTYLRAGLGGHEGRALRNGDKLTVGPTTKTLSDAVVHWHLSPSLLPPYSSGPVVRVTRGAQWSWFAESSQYQFFDEKFTVSPKSDRMGLRFTGQPLELAGPREMVSEAVAFGSVQVPPDGQPIVLMADRQTIGGYPKICDVVSVDLPLLAQLRPGDHAVFSLISLEQAQTLHMAEEHALSRLQEGLAEKLN